MVFDQSDLIYTKKSWQQAKILFIMLHIFLSNFDPFSIYTIIPRFKIEMHYIHTR